MRPFLFLGDHDEVLGKYRKAVDTLAALRERMGDAQEDLLGYQQEKAALDGELLAINDEIAELAGHFSECPVCGTLLNGV